MRLLEQELRGAIGIKRGTGLDEITIDFSKFEPGIIALVGDNGSGKTTLLENMHPYRRLASREGAIQKHFYLKDSLRRLKIETRGVVYESVIRIDGITGTTTPVLFKLDGYAKIALSDGLSGTYDAAVERIFGPEELFFKSVFAYQKAQSFAEMTKGERKRVFIQLLGHSKYENYSAMLKDRAGILQVEANTLDAQRRSVTELVANIPDMEYTKASLSDELKSETEKLSTYEAEKVKYEEELTAANQRQSDRKVLEEKIHGLLRQKQERSVAFDNSLSTLEAAVAKITREYNENEKRQERLSKIRYNGKAIADALEKIAALEAEISVQGEKAQEYNDAHAKIKAMADKIHREEIAWQNRVSELKHDRAQEDNAIEQADRAIENAKDSATRERDGADKRAGLVKEVPCRETPDFVGTCKLLDDANKSKSQVAQCDLVLGKIMRGEHVQHEEKAKAENARAAIAKNLEEILERKPDRAVVSDLEKSAAMIGYDSARMKKLKEDLVGIRAKGDWYAIKTEFDRADGELEILDRTMAEQRRNREQSIADRDAKKAEMQASLGALALEISDLQNLIDWTIESAIKQIQYRMQTVAESCRTNAERKNKLSNEIAAIEGKIEAARNAEESAKEYSAQWSKVSMKLKGIELVRTAVGLDGIPAMELDAASGSITDIANTLLRDTFGSEFQIAFETVRQVKDKTQEVFDIKVMTDQGEVDIANLSGGQQVWNEKAIRDAICILLSQNDDYEYATMFVDEVDGPLSPTKKENFLAMQRATHSRGGRHHTLLISQTPEIWQQIQQRIVFSKGRIQQVL